MRSHAENYRPLANNTCKINLQKHEWKKQINPAKKDAKGAKKDGPKRLNKLPCYKRANFRDAVKTFNIYKARHKARHYTEQMGFGKNHQEGQMGPKLTAGTVTSVEKRKGMQVINWEDDELFRATNFESLDQLLESIPDYKEHLIHRNAENRSLLESTSKGKSKVIDRVECKYCKNKGSDSDARTIKNKLDSDKHKKVVERHDKLVKTYPQTTSAPNPNPYSQQRKSSSPSPSQSPKRSRLRGIRGFNQGSTLSGYKNVNFEDVPDSSDSSNEREPTVNPFALNGKSDSPMSMKCAEILGSPIVQELLEMDKANFEITSYLAFMMAHSLHMHGIRWMQEKYYEDGNLMYLLLDGWSKQLKVSDFWLINFDEDKHPFKNDLLELAMSCMKGVLPEKLESVPASLRPENNFYWQDK